MTDAKVGQIVISVVSVASLSALCFPEADASTGDSKSIFLKHSRTVFFAQRTQIAKAKLHLAHVRPAYEQQEMMTEAATGIRYWEGAIEVVGASAEAAVAGQGYLELTGYVGEGLGSLFAD